MNKQEITEKVFEIVTNTLTLSNEEVQNINIDTHLLNDLGADELDTIEIVVDCERQFNISIEDDIAFGIETISELVDAIYFKLN